MIISNHDCNEMWYECCCCAFETSLSIRTTIENNTKEWKISRPSFIHMELQVLILMATVYVWRTKSKEKIWRGVDVHRAAIFHCTLISLWLCMYSQQCVHVHSKSFDGVGHPLNSIEFKEYITIWSAKLAMNNHIKCHVYETIWLDLLDLKCSRRLCLMFV